MPRLKATMEMLLRGGYTYDEIAGSPHVSKCDVRECARELEERGITAAELAAMGAEAVEALFRPAERGGPSATHLQPDVAAYVERKKKNRKLPLLLFWSEYCSDAVVAGLEAYAYSTFCQKFSEEAQRSGATRHFEHGPGAKAYVDWCGDAAHLTDRATGADEGLRVRDRAAVLAPLLGRGLLRHEAGVLAGRAHPRLRVLRRRDYPEVVELSGEPVTWREIGEAAARIADRDVEVRLVDRDEFVRLATKGGLDQMGFIGGTAYEDYAIAGNNGEAASISEEFVRVLGHPLATLDEGLRELIG